MKKGEKVTFKIYGNIVEGNFIEEDGDCVLVKVTKDFIKENIGTEQLIHKNFMLTEN